MADIILQFLTWAIPSGGIGAAIAWFFNRRAHNAETAKVVHDTYKQMYEDVSKLLIETREKYEETYEKVEELSQEYARTRTALNRLSRAVEAIQLCPYRSECPVRGELQKSGDDTANVLRTSTRGNSNAHTRSGGRRQRNAGGQASRGFKRKGDTGSASSGNLETDEPAGGDRLSGQPEGEGQTET